MRNVTTRETVPCAYVTIGKQRIKQFNNTVYLNNGDEFEIELFNPTSNKVLARIELNGNSIGAGIVLRPGERIFLERYIETARKFLFETYTVNGDNSDVQRAIALNGQVNVKFYGEYINPAPKPFQYLDWYYQTYDANPFYDESNALPKIKSCGGTSSNAFFSSANSSTSLNSGTYTTSVSFNNDSKFIMPSKRKFKSPGVHRMEKDSSKIETGRIEKGSASNQTFQYDSTNFNTHWSWTSDWKILPRSQKPVGSDELNALWCGNCGAKKGKGKFCQFCGSNQWIIK